MYPGTHVEHSPTKQVAQPIGHLLHWLSLSSNPSTQVKQMLIFLGSQLPLQLPKHLTHFPFCFKALPWRHVIQILLFVASHSMHPLSHWWIQSVPTRVKPLLQVKQLLTLAGLQVLQLPTQAVQSPVAKIRLSAHLVQTVADEQVTHPGSHGRQTSVLRKNLDSH